MSTTTSSTPDRAYLERAAAEARAAVARARLVAEREGSLAREADLALARLDLGPAVSERLVRRATALRTVLSDTGHPVLDVLVLPSDTVHRPGGHVVRVEFLYGNGGVGVLRGHLEWLEVEVVTSEVAPLVLDPDEFLAHLRENVAPASGSTATPTRTVASNEDLRALLATPASVREAAARLAGSFVVDVGLYEVEAAVDLLRLEVDFRPQAASAAGAAVVVTLVRDLASGAPEEWALRRATGEPS